MDWACAYYYHSICRTRPTVHASRQVSEGACPRSLLYYELVLNLLVTIEGQVGFRGNDKSGNALASGCGQHLYIQIPNTKEVSRSQKIYTRYKLPNTLRLRVADRQGQGRRLLRQQRGWNHLRLVH